METNGIRDLQYRISFEDKIELAEHIIKLFELQGVHLVLTGSLLLRKLGIIDREVGDIDFVTSYNGDIPEYMIPPFCKDEDVELLDNYLLQRRFYYLGNKIEILHDAFFSPSKEYNKEEAQLEVIERMLDIKKDYAEKMSDYIQKWKHKEDIPKIEQWLASKRTKQC